MKLFARTTISLLIVGLLPLFIIGGFYFTSVENAIRRTVNDDLLSLSVQIGEEEMRIVLEGYNNVLLLAENPIVRYTESPRDAIAEELTKTQRFHRVFKDITFLSTTGRIKASVYYSFRGGWSKTKWFTEAMNGKAVFSNVHAVLYPFDIVLTVATPVRDVRGTVIGVLVGQLDMEPVWEVARNVSVAKSGEVYLLDSSGIVIASPREEELLEPMKFKPLVDAAVEKMQGAIEIKDGKTRKLAVFTPIREHTNPESPDVGWNVVIVVPKADAYRPLRLTRLMLLVAAAACITIIGALSPLFSTTLSKRIKKLVRAADSLGKGDFSTPLPDLGRDEVGDLGRTFTLAGRQLAAAQEKSREAEDVLRRDHLQLEDIVRERTTELAASNEQLRNEIKTREKTEQDLVSATLQAESANRAKSEFLANMSHELRTPLNHIMGFTELVLDGKMGTLNTKQEEFLNDVLTSSKHLLSLINDILDLSKVEAGKQELELAEVRLRPLLENSFIMIKEKALKHRIELLADIGNLPEIIKVDERRMKQILYNLLSNSVKFTPDGGRITLSVRHRSSIEERALSNNGGFVQVSVTDTGIGIRGEIIDKLFKPFEQGESSASRRFQGTGLGLSLAKKFVELHGGTIWAESGGEGKGSRFSFAIPVHGPS